MKIGNEAQNACKDLGRELSARPRFGDMAGVSNINTHTHTMPRGMLVASFTLTILDWPSH